MSNQPIQEVEDEKLLDRLHKAVLDHGPLLYGEAANRLRALSAEKAELLEACRAAEDWLSGWASADPYIGIIRAAIAKAHPAGLGKGLSDPEELSLSARSALEAVDRLRSIKRSGSYRDSIMDAYGSRPIGQFYDDVAAVWSAMHSKPQPPMQQTPASGPGISTNPSKPSEGEAR